MRPVLRIHNNDYAEYIAELQIAKNDLDADGSGRNVLNGQMFRSRTATKMKLNVSMLPFTETQALELSSALAPEFVSVGYLNPMTNAETTGTFYCSEIDYGMQSYHPSEGITYYNDIKFSLTER